MKSEHRHELKTNELAEWLINFPHWFKQNLHMIMYLSVGIVVIASIFIYFWYTKNVRTVGQMSEFTNTILTIPQQKMRIINDQIRGSDSSYVLLQSANELELIAKNSKEEGMVALAYIKNAEIIRTELHYRPRAVTQAEIRKQINSAKKSYNQAIERSASIPTLRASAQYGLGLCEEELSNFAEAKKIYEDIINTVEYEGTIGAAQAKLRLKEMDNYQQLLVFQPRPTMVLPQVPEETVFNPIAPQLDIDFSEVNSPNL
ncbi:MAG: tetratricopeptide repeat protein [Planctomycetota bacterium]|jgi:tetratricopeptide (TPR) repeat protein